MNTKKPMIDPADDDFGAAVNCAIRYCLGRRTYMPGLIQNFVRPLLPYLSPKTLGCMERDIRVDAPMYGGYGDESIDKPRWMLFLSQIQAEMKKRGIDKWPD